MVYLPVGKGAQVVGGCLFSELFGWVGAVAVGRSEWAPTEAELRVPGLQSLPASPGLSQLPHHALTSHLFPHQPDWRASI